LNFEQPILASDGVGAWLQVNTTTSSWASVNESRDHALPSTPGSENGGAGLPIGMPLECIKAMATL
jgi:hypothetical protein